MTTYHAKRVKGVSKLRKTLNRLEPEEKKAIQKVIAWGAHEIEKDAIGLAVMQDIRLTGEMIASIDVGFSSDKLTAIVGPAAKEVRIIRNPWNTSWYSKIKRDSVRVSKMEAQWNLMKAWWAEFGTGPPIPQEPQPFMEPAWQYNKAKLIDAARKTVISVLKKVSAGP